MTNADDVMLAGRGDFIRRSVSESDVRDLVVGENVRDWGAWSESASAFPYGSAPGYPPAPLSRGLLRWLWGCRTTMGNRATFGGSSYFREGREWFRWHQLTSDDESSPFVIAAAALETHNNFVVLGDDVVLKQSVPIIRLPSEATLEEHYSIAALLNSSTACFWFKQVCHCYGSGANSKGERQATTPWESYYDFAGKKIGAYPLPDEFDEARRGLRLFELAGQLEDASTGFVNALTVPDRIEILRLRSERGRLRSLMISEQEELDWDVYRRYGLLGNAEAAEVVSDGNSAEPLELGERAFEIVLARRMAAGETETQWFTRHGSTPIKELPAHWSERYRRTVEARIALIEKRRDLALIERPECKRRWSTEPWEKLQERALRSWLLDRLEARELWFAPDMNGDEQPTPHTVRTLADQLQGDKDFLSVAALWVADALGRPDAELAEVVGELVDNEHVPFLAAYRYKPKGLEKRAEWERTWELQRQEDAIAARLGFDDVTHKEVRRAVEQEIGEIPVPPKYTPAEFLRGSYWSQRGKLDVPKERFVSYPAASRDGDGSLLLGWAGWDHREQAQALAVLITQRRGDDGWPVERVTPLLAGLAEVLPWVRQWHGDVDPQFGASPADIYDGFLDAQLGELHLSRDQLASWRPTGRVDVSPMPRRATPRASGKAAPRQRRTTSSAPDPAQLDAVLAAASVGPLSNEQIRAATGLDAASARAVAQRLVADGRLVSTGQRRGMRYVLP